MIQNIQAHHLNMTVTVSRMDLLIFIHDVFYDGISRMILEFSRDVMSGNLQKNASNLIWRNIIIHQDNDSKDTANRIVCSSHCGEKVEGFGLTKVIVNHQALIRK